MKICYRKFAVLTLLSALVPVIAQAAVPRAMLEKSATYALNDSVHAFRVPTVDNLGKIKFYDVIIDLTVNTNGTISPTANVSSNPSPSVTTGVIAPGTYQEAGGTDTCKVVNMTLTNGRIQSFFTCTNAASVFEFSVATGPITAGHPYLDELKLKKVNLRTDVATQTWGIVTNGRLYLGLCNNEDNGFYFEPGTAIGAKTNGSQIVISVISNNHSPNSACGNTLTKK
ncbi:MAG: hypothetical protein PHO08_05210 [Methylococcales bacterium]|nr:hypothetical protein [Methylococcales bacterium]MDD5632211.1 hypothetical protein [Methylococcales bacterium]